MDSPALSWTIEPVTEVELSRRFEHGGNPSRRTTVHLPSYANASACASKIVIISPRSHVMHIFRPEISLRLILSQQEICI